LGLSCQLRAIPFGYLLNQQNSLPIATEPKCHDFGASQVVPQIAFPAASPPVEASDHRHP